MRILVCLLFLFSSVLKSKELIVQVNKPFSTQEIKQLEKSPWINKIDQPSFFKNSVGKNIYFLKADSLDQSLKLIKNYRKIIGQQKNHPISLMSYDPFSYFQWTFFNKGQIFYKDQYIFKTQGYKTQKGVGFNYDQIKKYVSDKIKRNVVVAVIDTGVDFRHPDLKNSILRNKAECDENGNIPFEPENDNDQNGLKGDCLGWNFAASSEQEARTPIDRHGHGTHIAGIIAAESQNMIGISSLSHKNHIKILPIKVNHDPDYVTPTIEIKSRLGNKLISRSDIFLKSLIYAIDRKVDIINMSIGWNKINDNSVIRKVIRDAYRKGIIIVAAAGNSSSKDPIYPCAYPEVICVGSTNNQGELSHFSNYGPQVDILAPGSHIISTYPTNNVSQYFRMKGYEVLSGTSQATPLVSATAALLKSIYPKLLPHQLEKKLFTYTKKNDANKNFSLHGELSILESLKDLKRDQKFIFPKLKINQTAVYSPKNQKIFSSLFIKNLGESVENITIKLKPLTEDITFLKDEFSIKLMKENQLIKIDLQAKIKTLLTSSNFDCDIQISYEDQSKNYRQSFDTGQAILEHPKLIKKPIQLINKLILTSKSNDIIKTKLLPLPSFHQKSRQEYYLIQRDENQIKSIHIIREEKERFRELKEVSLKNTENILAFFQLDVNYDQELDYILIRFIKDHKTRKAYFQIDYFDQSLNSYLKDQPIKYPVNSYRLNKLTADFFHGDITNFKNISFLPTKIAGQLLAMPHFIVDDSIIPKEQQVIDDFTKISYKTAPRIFSHLISEESKTEITLKTQTYFDQSLINKLRNDYGHHFLDNFLNVVAVPQDHESYYSHQAQFIVNFGRGLFFKTYLISIDAHQNLDIQLTKKMNLKDRNSLWTEQSIQNSQASLTTAQTRLRDHLQINTYPLESNREASSQLFADIRYKFPQLISQHQSENTLFSYILSHHHLIKYDHEGELISLPLKRYSFIPQRLFYLMHQPVKISQDQENLFNGIFRNGTELTDSNIQTYVDYHHQIIAPLALSFKLPTGCKALTPYQNQSQSYYRQICQVGKDQWEIHQIPLSLEE